MYHSYTIDHSLVLVMIDTYTMQCIAYASMYNVHISIRGTVKMYTIKHRPTTIRSAEMM